MRRGLLSALPTTSPLASPARSADRIGALDGLRGLAILAVIGFHADAFFGGQYGAPGNVFMSRVLGAGWIGVQLFFVLSGYLITSILLERKTAHSFGGYVSGFYLRRACRILPLYYGFLLLYLGVIRHIPPLTEAGPIKPEESTSLFLFFYNYKAAIHPVPVLHMYWSLCVEEQFYLVWPFLVWFCSVRSLRWISGTIVGFALIARLVAVMLPHGISFAYLATPCVLDAPAIGSLIAVLHADSTLWARIARRAPTVTIAALGTVLSIAVWQGHFYGNLDYRYDSFPVQHDSSVIQTLGVTAAVIFFAATLVLVLQAEATSKNLLSRLLNWTPLRSIGFYSYAMYMFHRVVLHETHYFGSHWLPTLDTWSPTFAKPVIIAVVTLIAYGLARVSYVLWERPFLRYGRRHS